MMQAFRTENNYRNASRLSAAELRAAMASREILQSTALAFDTQRQLRFELGGCRAVMPFGQCADGADTGSVRDIAVLTRVGRPTCFVIEGIDTDENGQPVYRLSRAEAQRMCKAEYLDQLQPGDILPCIVTHIEPFGAFCDVGCGISALLPIDCMSVSRISSPADRVSVGQQILCAIKSRDVQGRFVLTIRELLGTWAENAAAFYGGRNGGGHRAERGRVRHLHRDSAQPRGPRRELPRPAPRAGCKRLHQEHPAREDEDKARHRQPRPQPEPPLRAAVLHHRGPPRSLALLHPRKPQAHRDGFFGHGLQSGVKPFIL